MSITALMCMFFTIVAFVLFARLINNSEKTEADYLKDTEVLPSNNQKSYMDLSGGSLGI